MNQVSGHVASLMTTIFEAAAGAIAQDRDGHILATARLRLVKMRASNRSGNKYYDRWEAAIDAGAEAVMELLCDTSEEAQPLRSSSPIFFGDLADRDAILDAFDAWWKTQQTKGDFLVDNIRRPLTHLIPAASRLSYDIPIPTDASRPLVPPRR